MQQVVGEGKAVRSACGHGHLDLQHVCSCTRVGVHLHSTAPPATAMAMGHAGCSSAMCRTSVCWSGAGWRSRSAVVDQQASFACNSGPNRGARQSDPTATEGQRIGGLMSRHFQKPSPAGMLAGDDDGLGVRRKAHGHGRQKEKGSRQAPADTGRAGTGRRGRAQTDRQTGTHARTSGQVAVGK
jgi:hypothetical protein